MPTVPAGDKSRIREGRSLTPVIHEAIRNRICLLEYPPGMVLREEALAEEFGVSRTPIRSALQRLEIEGLIEIGRRSGAVVTTIDLVSLKEVYALRLKLAEFMGEMMSSRVTEDDLAAMQAIIERCNQLDDSQKLQDVGRLYLDFHNLITAKISNKPMRKISDQLFHQTSRVWLQILPDLNWADELEIACQEMTDVYDAFRARDMIAVGRIRHHHMVKLLNRIGDYLGSAGK